MSVPKTITAKWLIKNYACNSQVRKFRELFGEEVVIDNPLIVIMAYQHGMNVNWLRNYMGDKQLAKSRTSATSNVRPTAFVPVENWVMGTALVLGK